MRRTDAIDLFKKIELEKNYRKETSNKKQFHCKDE